MKKRLACILVLCLIACSALTSPAVVRAMPDTETLRPNAAGDACVIPSELGAACPNHYQNVDEVNADDASTQNYALDQAGTWTDWYNLDDTAIPAGATVTQVKVYIRGLTSTVDSWFKAGLKLGGSTTWGAERVFFSWHTFDEVLARPGGGSWQQADLDSLQVGVQVTTILENMSRVTQVYVVVDYVVLPSITTTTATNVATTTARLNSTLVDDGGESCNVSFQYNTSEDWVTCDNTSWVSGYTTGQYPYADISGLDWNTLYYFRARAKNSVGTVNGTALSFTTESGVGEPTNLKSFPEATSVALSWTKGTGSTNTLVRHKVGGYPTSTTDGTLVYLGTLGNCAHTGLASGNTFYYSVWGVSGDNYSASYTTVMATTSGAPGAGEVPGAPPMPPTWFQTPDYTIFVDVPFYGVVNAFFDSYEIPKASGWFFSAIFGCIVFGLLVFAVSRHPLPTLIALAVAFAMASLIKLLPMWMMAFTVIFILGAFQLGRTRSGI